MRISVKKLLLGLLFITVFFIGAFGSFFFFKLSKVFVKKANTTNLNPTASPTPSFDPNSPYNVLLLGYGGEGHEGGNLTDSIIVANINPVDKAIVLISIPRDLWIPLPIQGETTQSSKINAAYAIGLDDTHYTQKKPEFTGPAGGGELAKYSVGVVTGLPVNYFVSVNFQGFRDAIDILGGIEVDVAKTFDDYFYPVAGKENESCGKSGQEIQAISATMSGFLLEKQFTCRYEQIHFDKGTVHMDGTSALKFVRSRHSDEYGGDFARSERQYAVLAGVKNKIISLGAVAKAGPIFEKLVDSVRTDLNPTDIKNILETSQDLSSYKIKTIHLTEDNVLKASTSADGAYILIPKAGEGGWAEVHKFIKDGLASD